MAERRLLHSRAVLTTGSGRFSYEYWKGHATEAIVESLLTDGDERLRVSNDGVIKQGNTRMLVLMERGYDIDSISAEIV